jgi:hypothetical protein
MNVLPQLPLTPEVEALARRVVWFESPRKAVSHQERFLAYVMTYGTFKDVEVLRKYWSDDDLRAAVDAAPPGIFDSRSWAYWNVKLGRYPTPPMPQRTFGAK